MIELVGIGIGYGIGIHNYVSSTVWNGIGIHKADQTISNSVWMDTDTIPY